MSENSFENEMTLAVSTFDFSTHPVALAIIEPTLKNTNLKANEPKDFVLAI